MQKLGLQPDPWQVEVLTSEAPQILMNCCRQAGKSTVVAVRALVEALFRPMTTIVVVSRSQRQSRELLRTIRFFHTLTGERLMERSNQHELKLTNMSRIISLPCREDTIRGFAQVDLVILDEAARIPDDLYRAVRPMLAVSKGRIMCLSTPYGKRGFFWKAWAQGGDDWLRIEAPATKVSRIDAEFLERERRGMGESWFRQEYCCSFEAMEGLVYPDFAKCIVPESAMGQMRLRKPELGGLDFGFRNPFAALWGFTDSDDVLWITGEHYARQKPLSWHAERLPGNVTWHADPAGANEIAELRCAGFRVRPGINAIRPGIAAVSARIEAGTLKVLEGRCPHLVSESMLYRHSDDANERRAEIPLDEHNHALAALRYLIMRIDARRTAKPAVVRGVDPPRAAVAADDDDDDAGWIRLWW